MKINCGPTRYEKRVARIDKQSVWHRWYAWYPVRIGKNDCRWLEYVDRRIKFWCWSRYDTEYRSLSK